jgi:small subunit ribosomal protein S7
VQATFKNRKAVEECLADEILMAAKGDMQSSAIAKKEELERIASSAR